MPQNTTKPNRIYSLYMHKQDLVLNNPQRLICHKTQPNQKGTTLKLTILVFHGIDVACADDFQEFSLLIIIKSVKVVQPYNSIDTATAWKNSRVILSVRSDFHIIDNRSIAVHVFPLQMLTSLSVDEMLLPSYVNWFTSFRGLPFYDTILFKTLKLCFILIHVEVTNSCCLLQAMR